MEIKKRYPTTYNQRKYCIHKLARLVLSSIASEKQKGYLFKAALGAMRTHEG